MARSTGGDVGTEHVLMTIAATRSSRARRVLQDLGADFGAIKRELAGFVASRRSSRRRRPKANDGAMRR